MRQLKVHDLIKNLPMSSFKKSKHGYGRASGKNPWPTPSHLHWAPPCDMTKHPKSCVVQSHISKHMKLGKIQKWQKG